MGAEFLKHPGADERRSDAEKDTELSAPIERILGSLGLVDALADIEGMTNPDHDDERWIVRGES